MKKKFKPLAIQLQLTKKRNKDAFKIIGAVSGLGEKRIKEIAEGSEFSIVEEKILEVLK